MKIEFATSANNPAFRIYRVATGATAPSFIRDADGPEQRRRPLRGIYIAIDQAQLVAVGQWNDHLHRGLTKAFRWPDGYLCVRTSRLFC